MGGSCCWQRGHLRVVIGLVEWEVEVPQALCEEEVKYSLISLMLSGMHCPRGEHAAAPVPVCRKQRLWTCTDDAHTHSDCAGAAITFLAGCMLMNELCTPGLAPCVHCSLHPRIMCIRAASRIMLCAVA